MTSTLTIDDIPNQLQTEIITSSFQFQHKYNGQIIVIKASGKIVENTKSLNHFAHQVLTLRSMGMKPVVIHGAGKQITAELEANNLESDFKKGLRVSRKNHLPIIDSVIRKTNTLLCNALTEHAQGGIYPIGMSAYDSEIQMVATPISIARNNYSSDTVTSLNIGRLNHILESTKAIPVITNMARATDGTLINVNADPVAAALAIALKAKRLLMCSDVAGVNDDSNTMMREITRSQFNEYTKSGVIKDGMYTKVKTAFKIATQMAHHGGGVVIMGDDFIMELLGEKGAGTRIVLNPPRNRPAKPKAP